MVPGEAENGSPWAHLPIGLDRGPRCRRVALWISPPGARCAVLCGPCSLVTGIAVPLRSTCNPPTVHAAAAAGMTLKFFSLFFFERCGMSPVYMSAISVASPLVISGFSNLARKVRSGHPVHP